MPFTSRKKSSPNRVSSHITRRRYTLETLADRRLLTVVSHWTADDTALDAVGGNHGMPVNGADYADGQVGRAFRFDGVNDSVVVEDDPSLALAESLSIDGWVRVDSLPTQSTGTILIRGDDRGPNDNPYVLHVQSNGVVTFRVNSPEPTVVSSLAAPVPVGEFFHVAGTLDDATGKMSLYLNGVLMSQLTTDVRPFGALDPASNPSISIGNYGSRPFDGLIDELQIHDVSLSGAEVLQIYNDGRGGLQPTISVLDSFVTEGTAATFLVDDFVVPLSGGLAGPRGIAFGPDGDLFVAASDPAHVLRYDGATGAFLGTFADASNAGQDNRTFDLVFHNSYLFVTMRNNNSVLRFDAQTGNPAPAAGKPGATFVSPGDGGLEGANGLDFGLDGHLYVSSFETDSVLRYDGNTGAFLGVYVDSGSGGPLAFGPDGNLYVGNPGYDEVLRYQGPSGNSPGAFMDAFVPSGSGGLDVPGPGGLAFSPSGDLYVSSRDNNQVLRYDGATGDFLESLAIALPGTLAAPRGLAFNEAGTLHVASGRTNAVLRQEQISDAVVPVLLSAPSPTPVTVQVNTVDGSAVASSDYVATSDTITFLPGDTSHLLRVPIANDSAPEPTEEFDVSLSSASGATIQGSPGSVTISDDDLIELFSDSFEVGNNSNDWNGDWFEDGQDDWFRGTQRSTDGNYSAEVDGKATNATLTMANPVDLTPYASATVSFSWYIEGGFDGGEYLKLEVWNGTSWTEKASLLGNVDQENAWHHESIEIDGVHLLDDFQVRFLAKANRSNEDANVDNMRLIATSLAEPPSQAPSITTSPVITATEDLPYSYDVDAIDPDAGDMLAFSLDASPSGMTIDATTGQIQWTPSNAEVGPNPVPVRVQDQTGAFATQTFSVSVTPTNDAPMITSSPVTSGAEGVAYAYDVDADDPDFGDTATYSLDQSPSAMTIDPNTGVISWTPQSADVGAANDLTVRVTDEEGAFDTQIFSINVSAPSEDVIYVSDIRFQSRRRGRDWRAFFEVRDQDSNPISGVQIEVTFAGNTYTGTTDSNGIFRTSWVKNLSSVNHYAEAVDLAFDGHGWDQDLGWSEDYDGDGLPDASLMN